MDDCKWELAWESFFADVLNQMLHTSSELKDDDDDFFSGGGGTSMAIFGYVTTNMVALCSFVRISFLFLWSSGPEGCWKSIFHYFILRYFDVCRDLPVLCVVILLNQEYFFFFITLCVRGSFFFWAVVVHIIQLLLMIMSYTLPHVYWGIVTSESCGCWVAVGIWGAHLG